MDVSGIGSRRWMSDAMGGSGWMWEAVGGRET